MQVLKISIQPELRRIQLLVEMSDPERLVTSQVPHLPRRLFRLLPEMATHRCENGHGLSFRQECRDTEIPHIFEHLIIELQGRAQPVEVLRGETEWDWSVDPWGQFHVTVEYENELLALGAIRLAEKMIRALDQKELETFALESEMEKLRLLAAVGRDFAPAPCRLSCSLELPDDALPHPKSLTG